MLEPKRVRFCTDIWQKFSASWHLILLGLLNPSSYVHLLPIRWNLIFSISFFWCTVMQLSLCRTCLFLADMLCREKGQESTAVNVKGIIVLRPVHNLGTLGFSLGLQLTKSTQSPCSGLLFATMDWSSWLNCPKISAYATVPKGDSHFAQEVKPWVFEAEKSAFLPEFSLGNPEGKSMITSKYWVMLMLLQYKSVFIPGFSFGLCRETHWQEIPAGCWTERPYAS